MAFTKFLNDVIPSDERYRMGMDRQDRPLIDPTADLSDYKPKVAFSKFLNDVTTSVTSDKRYRMRLI